MPIALTPQAMTEELARAVNGNDLDGWISDMYYDDAVMLAATDGTVVRGKAAIRATLAPLFALRDKKFSAKLRTVLETGDLAAVLCDWELQGVDPGSQQAVTVTGCTHDILRRAADGGWRVIIDNPYGTAR